jgi:glucose 1-dehydrogenase
LSARRNRRFAIWPGEDPRCELLEGEAPRPGAREYLVEIAEVGLDGTDRKIYEGGHGEPPEEDDFLIPGHEAVGRIVEAPRGGTLEAGTLVVPTVRTPCSQRCVNCRNLEVDFCVSGAYREHGIEGLHGFLQDYLLLPEEMLVEVPEELAAHAVLLEPVAIIEKTFRQIDAIQSRMLWEPRRLLITGAGNLGILAALEGTLRGLDVLLYSQGPADGARGEIVEMLGCAYVDSEEEELENAVDSFGAPDIFVEATGHTPLAWQGTKLLNENGVGALLGIGAEGEETKIGSDALNDALVMGNRALFGSVNAHRRDFETGVETLAAAEEHFPGLLERFITERVPLDEVERPFESPGEGEIKTVVVLRDL